MGFTVVNPGALTTVQDQGRIGYQQFGVPVSGAADGYSAMVGNILVGNDEKEAVIECTMLGPQIRFDTADIFAVTGGDLGPMLDGVPIDNYRAVRAEAGQVLSFKGLKTGLRAYIAFAGGLELPAVMGSRSTYLKAKIGGLEGRKLQAGDTIGFRKPQTKLPNMEGRHIRRGFVPLLEYTLRVVLGPQDDCFPQESIDTFLNSRYKVTPAFDRMGVRLEGPEIKAKEGYDIISDGIPTGAIQIAGGQPILMSADHQTTGGYTKIANVISADLRILGQLKAGVSVRFEAVSVQEAQTALLMQRGQLEGLKKALNQ